MGPWPVAGLRSRSLCLPRCASGPCRLADPSGFGQTALTAFQAVKNVQKAVKIDKKKKQKSKAPQALDWP